MIRISESSMSISFSIVGTRKVKNRNFPALSTSELSLSYGLELDLNLIPNDLIWYFFNRLLVPADFTPKNASVLLMKETINWADKNKFGIIDALNPYGRLNLEQLIKFNMLFGFKKLEDTLMIRFPKN